MRRRIDRMLFLHPVLIGVPVPPSHRLSFCKVSLVCLVELEGFWSEGEEEGLSEWEEVLSGWSSSAVPGGDLAPKDVLAVSRREDLPGFVELLGRG